jgi:hypothetical protein
MRFEILLLNDKWRKPVNGCHPRNQESQDAPQSLHLGAFSFSEKFVRL